MQTTGTGFPTKLSYQVMWIVLLEPYKVREVALVDTNTSGPMELCDNTTVVQANLYRRVAHSCWRAVLVVTSNPREHKGVQNGKHWQRFVVTGQ